MSPQKRRHQAFSIGLGLLATAALTLPGASGCSEEPEPEEVRNCDISALFASNCAGTGCHGSESKQGDLDLVSPGVERRLFHVESTEACGEQKLIDPGNPEGSLLFQKVTGNPPPCGSPMPPNFDLSGSEIECLESYIERAGLDADTTKCETCGGILCVDFDRDPKHCGGCGVECAEGQICGGRQCVNPCADGEALCGAACVVLDEEENHCGSCGHRCGPGTTCVEGACSCDGGGMGVGGAGGGSSANPVSFEGDILPLFENSCSGSDCHTGSERVAPLDLDPSLAYSHLVDVTAEDCTGKRLVVPNNPDSSYLVDKLMGGSLCAGAPMPLLSDPLPNAAVGRVVSWICQGAPEN